MPELPSDAPRPAGQATPRPDAENAWLAKRKFARFNLPASVVLKVKRKMMGAFGMKREIPARMIDLSEGGIGLFITEELPLKTDVEVRVEVKQLTDVLEITGLVVRSTPPLPVSPVQEWIINIEFDEITKDEQIKIAGWRSFFASTMMRKKTDEKRRDFGLA